MDSVRWLYRLSVLAIIHESGTCIRMSLAGIDLIDITFSGATSSSVGAALVGSVKSALSLL